MKRFFLIAAVALTLASCNSTKFEAEKVRSLSSCEGYWELSLMMKDEVAKAMANADLTIAEKGGGNFHISGFMGANYFDADASSKSAGQIKVEYLKSTKRGASPEIMEFETLFSEFLAGVDSYSVEKPEWQTFERLVLKNSAMNAYAHFSRNSIFDKIWKLNSINDGNAVTSVSSGANVTLMKNKDGNYASVFTGINQANLGVKVDEKKCRIAFSDGPMTRMAGSEDDMRMESLFTRRLFKASQYSLSGGILSLYDGEGTLLLEFENAGWIMKKIERQDGVGKKIERRD